MNSNYHMSEFIVKERIQTQQQAAAAHRLARLAAKSIFAASSFGGGLVRDAFAVKTAVR
jgi:hypothetical protein